ncbi:hypothetical protein Tco_0105027 [Tanacetum coccineum]
MCDNCLREECFKPLDTAVVLESRVTGGGSVLIKTKKKDDADKEEKATKGRLELVVIVHNKELFMVTLPHSLILEGRESLAVMVVPSYGARIADGAPLRGITQSNVLITSKSSQRCLGFRRIHKLLAEIFEHLLAEIMRMEKEGAIQS